MPDNSWITVDYLKDMKEESENHPSRQLYLQNMRDGWKWYKKRTGIAPEEEYDDTEIPAQQSTSRDNFIKEGIDEVGAIFLKNDPVVRCYPHYPQDADLADDMDAIRLSAWRRTHIPDKLASMEQEACVGGLSVGKVYWNPQSGRIEMVKIDPSSVFLDPFATNDNRLLDCRYIIHKTRLRIDIVLRRYGKEAEVALGLRDSRGRSVSDRKYGKVMSRFANMTREQINRKVTGESGGEKSEERADPLVGVYEYWIFPVTPLDVETVADEKKLDDAGYPYGVVVTMIEGHILKSRIRANPFVQGKTRLRVDENGMPKSERVKIGAMRHPFVPIYWDRVCDNEGNNRVYECMGMAEQMKPMQWNIDALRRNIYIHVRSSANPWTAYKEDAINIDPKEIESGPGDWIPLADITDNIQNSIYVNNGAMMSPEVYRVLEYDGNRIKQVVGLRPGVTGTIPPPGTSHTPPMTIGLQQEAAFVPLSPRIRELSNAILDISVIMDGMIQQFYKVGDYIDVSREGLIRKIEWTQRHVVANFRREIVPAATTAMGDIDKQDRLAMVTAVTNEALLSNNPDLMQSTIYYLSGLKYSYASDHIQLLRRKLEELQLQQQELQALGLMGLGQQGQQALPPAGELGGEGLAGLDDLVAATGLSAEQLAVALTEE